jgi:transcriptional regulator with XRE-family HTH domain
MRHLKVVFLKRGNQAISTRSRTMPFLLVILTISSAHLNQVYATFGVLSTFVSVVFVIMDNNRSSKGKSQLDEYLNSRGLSRAALARMSGVKTQTIQKWCDGLTEPTLRSAVQVSSAMGLSLKQFAELILADCPLDRVPDDTPDNDRVRQLTTELQEVIDRYRF